MSHTLFTIAAFVCYLYATGYLVNLLIKRHPFQQQWLVICAFVAIVLHGISVYQHIFSGTGVNLTITNVFSLVMLLINVLVVASSIKKPLQSLFILLFPFSSIAVGLTLIGSQNASPFNGITTGLGIHILLSIVAYSLLSIAVLQALLLYWQNSHLKKRQLSGFIKHLPPLQTMESLMFELVWVGVILLAIGIAVGTFYIEDMFAQHLAHKTILSITAWCIFAMLLVGRSLWGWRGNQAIRWVLFGFCVLMLAYFGSKLVVEVILG